jgi:carboxyl-terminal processing protease
VLFRALLSWRAAVSVPPFLVFLAMTALGGCGGQPQPASQAGGGLFARVFGEIGDLYIEPVSTRKLALSGLARLSRYDRSFGVSDGLGAGALAVIYEDRNIAYYPTPPDGDNRQWGDLVTTLIAEGRRVSPKLAALSPDAAEQAVLRGVAAALDRNSRYASPDVARDQRAAREGYGGIGVTVDPGDALFRVTSVVPHGPADRAGIRPEDQIVSVDGVATSGCLHQDVMHRLRGPVGSPVAVRILQAGMSQPRELRLSRTTVYEQTVSASRSGGILTLRVNSFNHSTTKRIADALAEAQRQAQLTGVVLDLRGNPGGLLDQAVSLADLFLPAGPIVSATGRHPASRQYFKASGNAVAARLPVAVLINGGSASASEIVAAALQDSARGVVIGSSSFGKGTVQTVLRLPNNGELILTWARLVAPSGYALQHGVVPTVCTADLADGPVGVATGLQRASAPAAAGQRARAGLDEGGWTELRRACPPRRTAPTSDVALAERLIADPALYATALRGVPATARGAQTAAASRAASP